MYGASFWFGLIKQDSQDWGGESRLTDGAEYCLWCQDTINCELQWCVRLVMMIMISVGECNERVLIAELRDGHPAIILTLNVSNAVTLGPCNVMPTILM